MSKYRENQALGTKMFEERKRDMMAKPLPGDMPYIKPGDENSKYYNKPDEAPLSHPAEVVERLRKEKPDAAMEDLIKEADLIIAEEMKERQAQRAASGGGMTLNLVPEEGSSSSEGSATEGSA